MRRALPGALLVAAVAAGGVLTAAAPAAAAPPPGPVVVASGLDNPRQLSLVGGSLLVAEAGRGGPSCSEETGCIGLTGAITKITGQASSHPSARKIVTGLLSGASPDGGFATGPDGVSARDLRHIYIAMTYAPPDLIPAPLPGVQAGKLMLASPRSLRRYADISAVEIRRDPDGQGVDSNPYAVLSLPGRQLVADAAGNTIIEVKDGKTRVFAVLPDHDGFDSVPTSLAAGPNGTIYVGELNGENPGTARVLRLSPTGKTLGYVGGFTTITGVAVGKDGTLYVSELFSGGEAGPPGQVVTVRPDGTRSAQAVPFPAGIVVQHGRLYVAAWSIADRNGTELAPGQVSPPGQVWRLSA